MTGLGGLLGEARVVVVTGAGGVGKTTTSAAVALELATGGRRTVVVTVDPARRLATALGLPEIPGEPVPIRRAGKGVHLDAMQLDTQRALDDLVSRQARSDEQRERILANRFYRRIADTLSGTHEYMAMEKLHELAEESEYEAIVIDTPPTRSALSFLDAPRRITDFLGSRFLRMVLAPTAAAGKGTARLTSLGSAAFARVVRRVTGAEVLADTAEFLASFEGMYEGFKRRARAVLGLLRAPSTRFLVVTAPQPHPLEEAAFFAGRLTASGMPLAAVVANRTHTGRPRVAEDEARPAAERLKGGGALERAVAAMIETRVAWQEVERREADALAAFRDRHAGIPVLEVPDLGAGVHDVPGLRRLAAALFAAPTL